VNGLALSIFVQSLVIFGAAILAARLVSSPHVRVAILRYAFVGMVASTLVRVVLPSLPVAPANEIPPPALVTPRERTALESTTKAAPAPVPVRLLAPLPASEPATPALDPSRLLLALWILGSIALLARTAVGAVWLTRLRKSAQVLDYAPAGAKMAPVAARFGVRDVSLALSAQVGTPFVAGHSRTTIYLPASMDYSDLELEAVLSHELAHVKRRDPLWALLTQIVAALNWPNPLVWWARREMIAATEERCDLDVLQSGVEPVTYADCLVRIAERSLGPAPKAASVAAMSSSSRHFTRRIGSLLNSRRVTFGELRRSGRAKLLAGAGAVAAASALVVPIPVRTVVDKVGAFPPSKAELEAAKASGLPYLKGDFTLTYHVVMEDRRTDAERQAEHEESRKRYERDLASAVAAGKVTSEDAKRALAGFVLRPRGPKMERDVTLSCRRGVLLYREGRSEALVTGDHVYEVTDGRGKVRTDMQPFNSLLMPLPGAGYAHFPLTFAKLDPNAAVVTAPDVTLFGAWDKMAPWEGALVAPYARRAMNIAKNADGSVKSIAYLNAAKPEYEFRRHVKIGGVLVASEFTRYFDGANIDYALVSGEDRALPTENFDPLRLMRGKTVDLVLNGGSLDFKVDADAKNLQALIDQRLALEAQRNTQNRLALAESDRLEAIPGKGPDIMPLYRRALAEARAEDKVVLAISTATICAPCHQLQRLLEDPTVKPIVDRHYKVLWIDCGELESGKKYENLNGTKLCKQLGIWTGFPSYCTVDGEGKVLVTVGTNGYPGNEREDEKLFLVLDAGRGLLSAGEKAAIQGYLNAHR